MSSTTEDLLDRAAPDLDEAAVRTEFDAAVKVDGRALTRIAPEVGIAYQTLSAWRGGSYSGDNQRITRAANAWLISREARARAKATLPTEPLFQMTKTASRIWEILDLAKAMPTIGMVVGGSGVGKTKALAAYTDLYPQTTWLVTMTPCHARIFSVLAEIAGVMKLGVAGRTAELFTRIVSKARGTSGLLILDEAQHLSAEALDQVRSIFDAANVGIVLAGNHDLDAHMGMERRRVQLAQISSRVGVRFPRERPLKADIAKMLDAWDVKGERERAELEGVALRPGGLRGLTMTLRIALGLASAAETTLAVEHIRTAWQQLSGGGA